MSSTPPSPAQRITPHRDWLATQALIFGVSCILAWLFPILNGVMQYGFVGLIAQLLPPEIQTPSMLALPGAEEGSLVTPLTPGLVTAYVVGALVIDLFLLNPLVYVFKHFFLPSSLRVGDHEAVIRRLRLRAMTLRWAAGGSLVLIIGLLLVGLLIFISADRLVIAEPETHSSTAGTSKAKDKPKDQKGTPAKNDPDVASVVSSVATRVAAALMLVFLVKILSNLYRYNVRLAAFSDSRADALEVMSSLGQKTPANLRKIASTLAADKVPFTETETPVGELVAALAPVVRKMTEVGEKLGEKKDASAEEKKP